MENIDPVYFLSPVVVVAFSFGLAAYWRSRGRLNDSVVFFSLVAYAGAILLKTVVQALTYRSFDVWIGGDTAALGAYFGLQTVVFEVGGAYAVARYAFSRGKLTSSDAEGYGISLALWENGVLVGGAALLDYAIYYVTLSGSGTAAQSMLTTLIGAAPSLFYPPSVALPLVGYSILERVSSLLVHFSWGYLCVLAVALRKRVFFLAALPMGLVDFLVPFEGALGLATLEGMLFAIGLASLAVAMALTRGRRAPVSPGSSN